MSDDLSEYVNTLQLHVAEIGAAYRVGVDVLHHFGPEDPFLDDLVMRVVRKVVEWRPDTETLRVPATWWDHWKLEHAKHPLFHAMVAAHPVRYRTYEARMFLPDFPITIRDGVHIVTIPYVTERWGYAER